MNNQYYIYEYTRKSPFIDKEELIIVSEKLLLNTSKEKPISYRSYNSQLEEIYKLILIITLEEGEQIEDEVKSLVETLKKKVKYNNKIYYYNDYQTKVGREVAAHQIDTNSERVSSYNRNLKKIEPKDKRDNIQAKVNYHFINNNNNNNNNNKEKEKEIISKIKNQIKNKDKSLIEEYRKELSKRKDPNFYEREVKAAIILINKLTESLKVNEVQLIKVQEWGWSIQISQLRKLNVKEFKEELKLLKNFNKTKDYTYIKINYKEMAKLVKEILESF